MTTLNHIKEMLSMAAMDAIVAMAGAQKATAGDHDYGVDGTIREIRNVAGIRVPGLSIDYQLKSTVNWKIDENYITYDLSVKNYNQMVERQQDVCNITPIVLVLLCLPEEQSDWLTICPERMILKKCCYWYKVSDQESVSSNKSTINIKIPKDNFFLPNTIKQIFGQMRGNNEI